jgi:hypothetical protein
LSHIKTSALTLPFSTSGLISLVSQHSLKMVVNRLVEPQLIQFCPKHCDARKLLGQRFLTIGVFVLVPAVFFGMQINLADQTKCDRSSLPALDFAKHHLFPLPQIDCLLTILL